MSRLALRRFYFSLSRLSQGNFLFSPLSVPSSSFSAKIDTFILFHNTPRNYYHFLPPTFPYSAYQIFTSRKRRREIWNWLTNKSWVKGRDFWLMSNIFDFFFFFFSLLFVTFRGKLCAFSRRQLSRISNSAKSLFVLCFFSNSKLHSSFPSRSGFFNDSKVEMHIVLMRVTYYSFWTPNCMIFPSLIRSSLNLKCPGNFSTLS